ncbi:hypothetical protein F7725_015712, partial [Dissostichus mawsoni]
MQPQVFEDLGETQTNPTIPKAPLYLFESSAESLKHSLHVASLLHGDDSGVVLLIHPDQEGLLIVVPEEKQLKSLTKGLSRPVSGHKGTCQQRRDRLVKQEVVLKVGKIPLESGQSLAMKAEAVVASGQVSCRPARAITTTRSTSRRSALEQAGGRLSPRILRPVRTRDDRTYLSSNTPLVIWRLEKEARKKNSFNTLKNSRWMQGSCSGVNTLEAS